MPRMLKLSATNFSYWFKILLFFCFLASQGSAADDFDRALATKNQQSTLTDQLASQGEPEFLPVTEAYKLSVKLVDSTEGQVTLNLTWDIAPNYYLYKERFKFKATPALDLTPSFSDEGIKKYDEFAAQDMTIFHNKITLSFSVPATTPDFSLKVTSQGCADAGLCYPPYSEIWQVSPKNRSAAANNQPPQNSKLDTNPQEQVAASSEAQEETTDLAIWQAVFFAFLGGVILNLMPCVFPVLSIKAFSLLQADKSQIRAQGWAYTCGVLICFGALATLLILARQGGEAIGWGFQLQSPGLIIALTYLFFIMGLSMSGVIEIGSSFMGAGQSLTQKPGLKGSFFTGVLAAVVASPCTAPFMGAALGFALTQPAYSCLAVFLSLGFGMAFPLLAICYIPNLANLLPKPGLWMETLKEALAFPLYISAIWLCWVLTNQTNSNVMAGLLIGAVLIALSFWLLKRNSHGFAKKLQTIIALAALISAILLPTSLLKQKPENTRWQKYSPELLADLRLQGRPVFIDLTADWCITCLANERVALSKPEVEAAFDAHNVATLKGDWTNKDEKISELLREYRRSGVPLYLWFPANREGKADVLPQLLSPSLVIDIISNTKTAN